MWPNFKKMRANESIIIDPSLLIPSTFITTKFRKTYLCNRFHYTTSYTFNYFHMHAYRKNKLHKKTLTKDRCADRKQTQFNYMKIKSLILLSGILSYSHADTFRVNVFNLETNPRVTVKQMHEEEIIHSAQFLLSRDRESGVLQLPQETTDFVKLEKNDEGIVVNIGTFGFLLRNDTSRQSVSFHGQCDEDLDIHCRAMSVEKGKLFQANKEFSFTGDRLTNYGELILLGDVSTDIHTFENCDCSKVTISGTWKDSRLRIFLGHADHQLSVPNVNFPNLSEVKNYGLISCTENWDSPKAVFQNLEKVNGKQGKFNCEGKSHVKLLKSLKFDAFTELLRRYSHGQELSIIRFANPITDIRVQLLKQIGRSLLPRFRSEEEQIKQLYIDTTEEYARLRNTSLRLKFGEPLTQEQLSALQKDIIWPEWHMHKKEGRNIFFAGTCRSD